MTRDISRRLSALEQRMPRQQGRVIIIGPHDPEPAGADFVIRIIPAPIVERG